MHSATTLPSHFNTPASVKSLGCAVIPGVFSRDQVAQLVPLADEAVRSSSARAGDVVLMNPLTMHASSKFM